MHAPQQAAKKRRYLPEIIITCIILLIPISAVTYCFIPRYYTYIAPGEIVSVRDIGVHGSVHFCYVREGLVSNLFEKWSAELASPDAEFEPTDASAEEDFISMEETGADDRDDTIYNALTSAADQAQTPVSDSELEQRWDTIIAEASNYYGDSLGLMLSIGLVEETQHQDFSKNGKYIIAGTGTIEADHTVGSVGAIRTKLLTAEQSDADFFFVPKDKDNFQYEGLSNEEEAEQVKQELDLKLQVVPVATIEEALYFLAGLNSSQQNLNDHA